MGILNNIINLVACGGSAVLGTGTKGCVPYLKKTKDLWFVVKGFVFDGTRALDKTYTDELQASGKLIVVNGIRTFTDNSGEDQIETLEDGTEQVTTLGLYKFLVQFTNGLYFHAALNSLSSFGQYDVLFVDTAGNILGTEAPNGSLKGFSVGMIQGQKLTFATDTAAQREGLAFQLTERTELDESYVYIQKQTGFDPRVLEGVNQVVLSYVNAPSATDTTLTIKAVSKQSGTPIGGIAYTNFLVKKNGNISNPTAGGDTTTAGTYVLTIAALSSEDILDYSLYDNTNSRSGISLDGSLYKSNTVTATVA